MFRQSYFLIVFTAITNHINSILSNIMNGMAESKECGLLILDSKDKDFLLETFKIFGMLSKSHNYDVCGIIKIIKVNINSLTSCKKQG